MLRRAILWLCVAIAVSVAGGLEGCHLMGSLNAPIPGVLEALHAHADPPVSPAPAPARRVVVVLIDGLGGDAFDARLREGTLGEVPWRVSLDSGVPSRSRPVYHALLTGVSQRVSGIRGNGFASARADGVPARVRAGGGRVAWMLEREPWFCELFCADGDLVVEGPTASSPEAFARVWDAAPDLLVVHLLDVDEAGHAHGADSPEYEAASRAAFQTVAAFRAIARARAPRDGALWLVGADHGHTAHGGHGGTERTVRKVTWVALFDAAPGEPSGASQVADGAPIADLAPTIARAMGVEGPRESLVDGLPLWPRSLGPPLRADPARVRAVEAALADADRRPLGDPWSRGVMIVGVLASTFGALVALRRRRGAAEAAVFACAIAGFVVAGPGLSMSAVRTEQWYLTQGLASLTVSAGAAWTFLRTRASPLVVAGVGGVFPAIAMLAMGGSLGRSDVTPLESVMWPSLGLVPPSLCGAILLVEVTRALAGGRRPS